MELTELARHWSAFGQRDPLWAVLTDPGRRHGGWDLDEFMATGRVDIAHALDRAAELGARPATGAALDFGCGVGRLTQALAATFEHVVGVDIAPSMIENAQQLNTLGDRCRYVVNETDDLAQFEDGSFDFIYTVIVLQHMRPDYSMHYLREFLRLLRPGGVAAFQIPIGEVAVADLEQLPAGAYRAELSVLRAPSTMPAGAADTVRIRVTNRGTSTWPAAPGNTTQLHVGNHWLGADGSVVVADDGRASLPQDLEPGSSCELDLPVRAPAGAGDLRLEVDVVHERISWFADRGSPTATCPVQVVGGTPPVGWAPSATALARRAARVLRRPLARLRPAAPASAPPAGAAGEADFEPVMEGYSVPEHEIRRVVAEAGGTVLAADTDWATGPTWHSRMFYVLR